ncbi:MAG TPA: hypothetical protein VF698_18025, partial [Thermoanaerobaculia bacterium]
MTALHDTSTFVAVVAVAVVVTGAVTAAHEADDVFVVVMDIRFAFVRVTVTVTLAAFGVNEIEVPVVEPWIVPPVICHAYVQARDAPPGVPLAQGWTVAVCPAAQLRLPAIVIVPTAV